MRHKGRQRYSVLTGNGRVRLRRVRWHSTEDGATTPVDHLLDRAERTFSQAVREIACRLGLACTSFDKAAKNLSHLTPIEISGESMRQLVEAEGARAAREVERGRVDPGWSADDCRSEEGPTRVYLGCDGVMVPLVTDAEKRLRRRKIREKRRRCGRRRRALPPLRRGAELPFKEFRVVTAYEQSQRHRLVACTPGDHEAAGRLMRSVASQVRLAAADETIANVDGAPWIRNQLELHALVDHIGLDYYHLRDYAQRIRREVFGDENAEGRTWLDELMHSFLEEGVAAAWDRLVRWRGALRGRRRVAADRLLGYVAERRAMIRYREFRQRGWQIGSGPTEAQCKTLTLRLKGRGRRWDRPHAQAVMALAALEASHQWNAWWTTPNHTAA